MHGEELFRLGQQALADQPFSRLLGASLTALHSGYAEITVPITPELHQQHGFVQGGVLSYAADNALTFAGGSVLGPAPRRTRHRHQRRWPAGGLSL